ncbi:response regulator [Methylobacterium durans]|uniref:response regulator n=1 Tax=Methylobacterium durans TaxID=2202825 RepID=UPI002AFED35D|nr:response regulator [Methylobacterium durans]MEA1834684.1 response regulator [Methylobacterium durans]
MKDRPRILVVEDETMLIEVVAAELEEAGYEVVTALTGEAAATILAARTPIDLLFTDIRLPGALDGWGVAEQARALQPDLPVIYVTGYSAEEPRQVRDSLLVMKPYRPSAIIAAARRLGIG